MLVSTTSYSALGLSHKDFKTACKRVAGLLPEFLSQTGADSIVVRGSSGLSVAFGLRMLGNFPIVVARKPGENSHSLGAISVCGEVSRPVVRYIILDDFVASGATVRGIIQDMAPAEFVGLLTYNGAHNLNREEINSEYFPGGYPPIPVPYLRFSIA